MFPRHFLDAVFVAEESGQMVECMARLSRQYEQQSQAADQNRCRWSPASWSGRLVATLMIVLIFRLYSVYLGRFDVLKSLK